jgi:hypothetical protein
VNKITSKGRSNQEDVISALVFRHFYDPIKSNESRRKLRNFVFLEEEILSSRVGNEFYLTESFMLLLKMLLHFKPFFAEFMPL